MNIIYKSICIILLISSLNAQEQTKKIKDITIQLSWFDQFQFAGYYMAKKMGYYEDLGLNVTILPFKFGINIPKEVNENKINFSIGRETLILQKETYPNIVALYATFQSSPLILLSTKESGIDQIRDLKNKRIMTTSDDASEVSIKAMISSQNIQEDDLIFLKHSHNIKDLINKKTDVISAYISKAPYYLKEKNIAYNIFEPKFYGFDTYSDILYTNKELLSNEKQVVDAFIKASLEGLEYAYSNIEESSEYIFKNYNTQNISKKELIYEAKELKKLSYYRTAKLGEIKKEKIKRIHDIYKVMGLSTSNLNLNDFIYSKDSFRMNLSKKELAYLKNKKELKLCIDPDYMPYEEIDKFGRYQGISSEYFKIFQKDLDIPIKLVKTKSWKESLIYIKDRQCDILSLASETKKRKSYLNFTNSYLEVSLVLATKINIPFINKLEDIKEKKIALVKNYATRDIIIKNYPYLTFVEVDSIEDGLNKVSQGEVFGFIENIANISYLFQTKSFSDLKISAKFDETLTLSTALRNDEPILLDIFNKLINNIKEEEKTAILNKYINVNYSEQMNYQLILEILAVVSIFFFAMLYRHFLLKKVNSTLKKNIDKKTKELLELNNNLELRILKEVEKSKKMQKQLFKSEKLASMGEMIGNIAHQWRQPLSAITTISTGLKVQKESNILDDNTFCDNLDLINENAQYLSKTIDDFRNFIKDERQHVSFNLKQKVESFLHLVETSIKEHQINLEINISSNIIMVGYPNELLQCLINIFNNSKDVIKDNKIDERLVFLDAYETDDYIYIEIKDNGGGINEKIIDKIYEPYFTTKSKSQGTGLGLNMVYKIISEGMRGSIEASNVTYKYSNKEFKGAKFKVSIPKINDYEI